MPPALQGPAAVLPGEADLLAAVVAAPADDTPKLVYADWLEEHADTARAGYLRAFVAALRSGKQWPAAGGTPKAWRRVIGAEVVAAARKQGMGGRAVDILRFARPAVGMKAKREAKMPVGASKFGGKPDLPAKVDWPARDDGRPLSFLAQLNFADVAGSMAARELPPAGLLSVFYDVDEGYVEEPDGWRVLYHPANQELRPREEPDGVPADARFRPCRLRFDEVLTLPDTDSPWSDELDALDLPDEYREVTGPGLTHQLLGYPRPLQNDMLGEKATRHLLTIDSDDAPGWMWGDSGLLYFTIAAADLRAGRFARAKCEMQCC